MKAVAGPAVRVGRAAVSVARARDDMEGSVSDAMPGEAVSVAGRDMGRSVTVGRDVSLTGRDMGRAMPIAGAGNYMGRTVAVARGYMSMAGRDMGGAVAAVA